MKKIICLLIVGLLICSLLAACGKQDNQNDATTKATETYTDFSTAKSDVAEQTSEAVTDSNAFVDEWQTEQTEQAEQTDEPVIKKNHGSAGYVEGTTLIVSIFASESGTDWDFSTDEDCATRDLMLDNMKVAVSWLTRQIGTYGAEANFIYDWKENPDLYYAYDFGDLYLVRKDSGGYWMQEEYLLENIPSEALMKKYQAQNIIYMFYFNTDESNTISSWTLSDRHKVETEIINVFVRNNRSDGLCCITASGLAHEIMHCFGAYDLYYASETIPQAYVNYCKDMISTDIMYTTNRLLSIDYLEFSRLDAYYLGLVDSCDEVTKWGLGKSTFSE